MSFWYNKNVKNINENLNFQIEDIISLVTAMFDF